jgi:hypothetical protein
MYPQLEHGIDAPAEFRLQLLKWPRIPGIYDQGLFANRVGSHSQRQSAVGIMQVIRRTNSQIVNPVLFRAAPQFLEMTVKPLDFGEKPGIGKILVQNPYGIVGIDGSDERISSVSDGP